MIRVRFETRKKGKLEQQFIPMVCGFYLLFLIGIAWQSVGMWIVDVISMVVAELARAAMVDAVVGGVRRWRQKRTRRRAIRWLPTLRRPK